MPRVWRGNKMLGVEALKEIQIIHAAIWRLFRKPGMNHLRTGPPSKARPWELVYKWFAPEFLVRGIWKAAPNNLWLALFWRVFRQQRAGPWWALKGLESWFASCGPRSWFGHIRPMEKTTRKTAARLSNDQHPKAVSVWTERVFVSQSDCLPCYMFWGFRSVNPLICSFCCRRCASIAGPVRGHTY